MSVASGYYDGAILDWIGPEIETLLRSGGEAHFVIGSNRGETAREDLKRLLDILAVAPARTSLFVAYYPDAVYHPKVYLVEGPGRVAALVGSPNLTAAAGTRNIETAIALESTVREPPLDSIAVALESARTAPSQNVYRIASERDLDDLARMGVIGVPRPIRSGTGGRGGPAAPAAAARRRYRFPSIGRIVGIPSPTARPPSRIVRPSAPAPLIPPPAAAGSIVVFVFSTNDLKMTGTREFSVPVGVRAWAASVLGAPIRPGQGNLMHVNILGRLAAAPNSVVETPEPVRMWSAGASGGTHQDVRLVLGSHLRAELEDLSVLLYGSGLAGNDIGVLELPPDPRVEPLRLTIYRPDDRDYAALQRMVRRVGRQQKPQRVVGTLTALPPWPY